MFKCERVVRMRGLKPIDCDRRSLNFPQFSNQITRSNHFLVKFLLLRSKCNPQSSNPKSMFQKCHPTHLTYIKSTRKNENILRKLNFMVFEYHFLLFFLFLFPCHNLDCLITNGIFIRI